CARSLACAKWRAGATTGTAAGALASFTIGRRSICMAGAACRASATVAAFTLCGFGGANALHHFLARSAGCGLHDFAAWGLACAAPDGLATHGNGLSLLAFIRAEFRHGHDGDFLLGKALNLHHEAFFVHAHQAHSMAFTAS